MACLRENLEFEKWMYETARKSSEQSRSALTRTLLRMPSGRCFGKIDFLFCGNHDATVVYALVSSCKAMGETRVNGWRMCCFGSPGMRITGTPSGRSCPTSELNKPTRINLD